MMSSLLLAVTPFLLAGALGQARPLTGSIPSTFDAVAQVIVLPADTGDALTCPIESRRWRCPDPTPAEPAVVVIIGESMIAARIVAGAASEDGAEGVHRWGRLVRIAAGGVAPNDLHDLAASGWKPERSHVRPHTVRFLPAEESSIRIVRVSDRAFWVAGDDSADDAFLSIVGPAIARMTMSVSGLVDSPPDAPVVIQAVAPAVLSGRVVTTRLEPAADVDVELFEPLRRGETRAQDSAEMVRRTATRTDADGNFSIDRLAPGSYTVAAIHPSLGRGTIAIDSLSATVVVRLTPPARASGRLLRARVPEPDARVRFVPDPVALADSPDVSQLVADATTTSADGLFALALPPVHDGIVQIVTRGGVSIRVPLSGKGTGTEIALGDIDVPEPMRLIVRLFGAESCTLAAAGPLNGLGMAIVPASQTGSNYWFDLPEGGEWSLNAECDGVSRRTDPSIIVVRPSAKDSAVDVRIVKSPGQP
jgi:hypothetical protein